MSKYCTRAPGLCMPERIQSGERNPSAKVKTKSLHAYVTRGEKWMCRSSSLIRIHLAQQIFHAMQWKGIEDVLHYMRTIQKSVDATKFETTIIWLL